MPVSPFTALLLVIAVALAIAAPWCRAQAIAATTSTPLAGDWPPHPASIFHWIGPLQQLGPGQEITVATVPTDRWLVLNGLHWSSGSNSLAVIERGPAGDELKTNENSVAYSIPAAALGRWV